MKIRYGGSGTRWCAIPSGPDPVRCRSLTAGPGVRVHGSPARRNTYHQTTENGAYGVYSVLDHDGHLYAGYGTSLFRSTDDPVADDLGAQAPLAVTGTVE